MTSYFIPPDVEDRIEWLMKRGRRREAFALVAIEWFIPRTAAEYMTDLAKRFDELSNAIGAEIIPILQRLADVFDD